MNILEKAELGRQVFVDLGWEKDVQGRKPTTYVLL